MKLRYALPFALLMLVPVACAAPPSGDLLEGAKWEYSLDRGQTWGDAAPVVRGGQDVPFHARTHFNLAGTGGIAALSYVHGLPGRARQAHHLNGRRIAGPVSGMYYKTIPAIDPKLLKAGRNELRAQVRISNLPPEGREADDMRTIRLRTPQLLLQRAGDLAFQTTPILGAAGSDYFTLACRTNIPARVTLTARPMDAAGKPVGGAIVTESAGPRMHRFRVTDLPAGAVSVRCELKAVTGGASVTQPAGPVRLLTGAGKLRIVAMADSRTNRRSWSAVAAAALAATPDLVLFGGDMVAHGRNDWEWDEHYVSAGAELLATVPFFTVPGNHEEGSPIYRRLFQNPPGADGGNWAQQVGPVLLVGIDGQSKFNAGTGRRAWLEKTLGESKAKFIFVTSHYPAWTSGKYGVPDDETGEMRDNRVVRARKVVVPILTTHKVTAMFAAHAHHYERSELPGLTHIVSAAAGAPLHRKYDETGEHNPYSKAFAKAYHCCVLEVDGDTCTMKVVDINGKVIDRRTWKARKLD